MAAPKNFYLIEEELFLVHLTLCETLAKTSEETNLWDKVLPSALFAYRTVNHDITKTDIETIPFEEITIGNYKDILQRRLDTILDSLVEAQIIAFEKIKQFQKKLKKKKTYKTLSLSISDLILEYRSDKDNVYVIKPKKTTTRREKIGSKMDKYLLESITAAILASSITIGKTIKEIWPIDKNLSYGRQLELYSRLDKIIEDIKLMKKTTSEIQAKILDIVQLDVPRVLTIAKRAKTFIQRFGLLDTKLILPQVLYTLSTKDFNKLVSFKLDKTLQIEYLLNSLILPELNLFGEDDIMAMNYE
ncbi:hypothetical protein G9A89_007482 [Geosiphon pyriformis]|nr:hypothetical protein G9A89_007482 [Geosiphon pyriformis]